MIDSTNMTAENCLFIMIDIQQKLTGAIYEIDEVVRNADILNRASEILDIPLLVTEHCSDKLGKTVSSIYLPEKTKIFEKDKFSIFTDEVANFIDDLNKPFLVIYGIEAHICVVQTCLDALIEDYHVLLVADAISSRKKFSKKIAMQLMSDKKVELVTTEMILFRLLKDARHPKFRDIAKLIK